MGEPLDNYTNVVAALKGMHDSASFSLSFNKITVSTVGVVSRLRKLALDCPEV